MKIALLGDIALIGRFSNMKTKQVETYFGAVRQFLSEYDMVVGNLEAPFCENTRPFGAKSAHLRSDPINVEILKYLGVTHVSLANNHMGDYGLEGYRQTIAQLDKANICWFGAEGKQLRLSCDGNKVALLGYCAYNTNPLLVSSNNGPGVNPYIADVVMSEMADNRESGYLNLLVAHTGQEHVPMPSFSDLSFARNLADSFDYVYCGHHPHVIQGVEQREGSPLFYSLGNFIFDDVYTKKDKNKPLISLSESNKTGIIATVVVENSSVVGYSVTPTYISDKELLIGSSLVDFDIDCINKYITDSIEYEYTSLRNNFIYEYLSSRKKIEISFGI